MVWLCDEPAIMVTFAPLILLLLSLPPTPLAYLCLPSVLEVVLVMNWHSQLRLSSCLLQQELNFKQSLKHTEAQPLIISKWWLPFPQTLVLLQPNETSTGKSTHKMLKRSRIEHKLAWLQSWLRSYSSMRLSITIRIVTFLLLSVSSCLNFQYVHSFDWVLIDDL